MYNWKFIMSVFLNGNWIRDEVDKFPAASKEKAAMRASEILIRKNSESHDEKYEYKELHSFIS